MTKKSGKKMENMKHEARKKIMDMNDEEFIEWCHMLWGD